MVPRGEPGSFAQPEEIEAGIQINPTGLNVRRIPNYLEAQI